MAELDSLDLALLTALREHPRAGALQLSRVTGVARATVQARLDRMEKSGVITGYGPDLDVAAAGYGVRAFVTLEIAQGALDRVAADLAAIPGVLEAHAITGAADVVCMVAAMSHADLQQTLLRIDSSPSVARSISAIVLSTVIGRRDLPLLTSRPAPPVPRSPAYSAPSASYAPPPSPTPSTSPAPSASPTPSASPSRAQAKPRPASPPGHSTAINPTFLP
jgi:DNA-binding Lrp family transcriptional regulator